MLTTRRSALAVLTASLAAPMLLTARAVAQTSPAADTGGQSDYVTQTLMVGTLALKTSQVAMDKATNNAVKDFATLEVAEQQTVASILQTTPAGMMPPELPPEDAAKVQELADMMAGEDFDRAYVAGQMEGHQRLLEIQKTLSAETVATIEVVTARLAEQAVTSHLVMLGYIDSMINGTPQVGTTPAV